MQILVSVLFFFVAHIFISLSSLTFVAGTVYLLMQIAVADLISLTQIKYELFYVSNRSWLDPPEMCGVYLGLDTFTNTAIVFFIVALNFHTISTYNLAQKTIARNAVKLMAEDVDCEISGAAVNDENDDDDDADDEDESNEKMVTRNQHHQRSIVIDYSKPKSYVSVQMPVIFIWLLAASMSVPLFWYGDILPSGCNGAKICGVIQYTRSNTVLLQFLLIKMRIVVPSACLAFSTIYVMATLLKGKRILSRPCGLDEDVRQILKLAAALSLTFILCSMQRLYGSLWFELISRPMMERKYAAFDKWIGIGGCMLHYAAPIVRPVIYCLFAPNVSMKCTVFCCSCCRRRW